MLVCQNLKSIGVCPYFPKYLSILQTLINVNKFAAVLSKHEINFNLGVQEGYMALPTDPNRIEQEL